jgi:hypothetical protein
MNFKLKTLVAAVMLSASAMSANAAIETNSGNSEFVFSAWDVNTGVGYTYDLDWNNFLNNLVGADQSANTAGNATLIANAKVSSSLIGAGGVIFDGVLSGLPFGASTSNVQWNLAAVDNAGRNRLLTTKDITDSAAATAGNNAVKNAVTVFAGYVPNADGFIATANAGSADTYAVTASTDGPAYAGNAGNNWGGYVFDTTNTLGAESFLYYLAQSTTLSSNATSLNTQLLSFSGENIVAKTYLQNGEWRLNIAAVPEVAPVPEPETYAMLLAGLGLMGFVARRRSV